MGICNLNTAILPVQFSLSLNDGGRTAHGRLMLVGGEHVCDVDGNMGSRDSSSQTKNQIRRSIITFEERPETRERNRQCARVQIHRLPKPREKGGCKSQSQTPSRITLTRLPVAISCLIHTPRQIPGALRICTHLIAFSYATRSHCYVNIVQHSVILSRLFHAP